ncbi:putative protein arginine methyltransferase [Cavenderia fasciculata]|uniref:type I protein arginine methyltransferase n=1 Tax=Cavenderia fasciculata TaxID=261658 RepID=F4Q7N7_CACFS|nr:putative protein arginine methyltransferase [Cavenderia fasciculata]EGG16419.1 putative protein arginine methyltransferase [Cavenderia fasciculata]|eukprot:XP_004354803.1 putative protein arginine methyltransferase [Cavenderia fasciculata]
MSEDNNNNSDNESISSSASSYLPTKDYFSSYFDLNVHEVMLKDKPRTLAYKNAIERNQIDFKDKVVMDIGAGTGILSMFAIRYGLASKVYAIEASPMANYCNQIIEKNGMSEKIKVINKKVEDVTSEDLDGLTSVDVIVSEWMGFYLLHESMLESVLDARDQWLNKKSGILFPTHGDIIMAPINVKSHLDEKVNYWDDVYGFDYSIFKPIATESLPSPWIEHLESSAVTANPVTLKYIDFTTIDKEELRSIVLKNIDFKFDHQLEPSKTTIIHGFSIWFNCYFIGSTNQTVQLSTAPGQPATHWKQTNILLPSELNITGFENIQVNVSMIQDSENPRLYDISIDFGDDDDEEEEEQQEEENEQQ